MTTEERPSIAPGKPCVRRWLFLALVFLAALIVDGGLPEAGGRGGSRGYERYERRPESPSGVKSESAAEGLRLLREEFGREADQKLDQLLHPVDPAESRRDWLLQQLRNHNLEEEVHLNGEVPLRGSPRDPLRKPEVWEERLRDGRFDLPFLFPLGAPEAKPVAKDVYRLTSEAVQKQPAALLRRDRDGRFKEIASAQLSGDKNLLTEQNRHDEAITDLIATGIYDAAQSMQPPVRPVTGETISDTNAVSRAAGPAGGALTIESIHLSIEKLANDENLHSRQSVGADLELSAAKLSDVSKITIVQQPALKGLAGHENVLRIGPPETELEVELKPVAGHEDRFLGRVKLDEVIRQINSAGF